MPPNNLEDTQPRKADTQPVRVKTAAQAEGPEPNPGSAAPKGRRNIVPALLFAFLALVLILSAAVFGAMAGSRSGSEIAQAQSTAQSSRAVEEQYSLGVEDLAQGRYAIARQRFEYVLANDPAHTGAMDHLAEAMSILFATATPTAPPPTITPTPTPDLRPIEELLAHAISLLASSNWSGVLDTLSALRQADAAYQVTQVDGMLYLALRNRGVDKILSEGNLQGGTYDLALAERFGPLDVQASNARDLARLYLIGSGFWEAYPAQAVYYFSQVAAAAPGLRDASGYTARERYFGALVQYGAYLAGRDEWCDAQIQYELALNIRFDDKVRQALDEARLECSPPTATITLTPTITLMVTTTITPTLPTAILPSETPTPTWTNVPPVDTPTPSETPVPPTPTETPPTPPYP